MMASMFAILNNLLRDSATIGKGEEKNLVETRRASPMGFGIRQTLVADHLGDTLLKSKWSLVLGERNRVFTASWPSGEFSPKVKLGSLMITGILQRTL